MNFFDQAIRLQDGKHPALPGFHQRTVITRPEDDSMSRWQLQQQLFEQAILTELPQFHCRTSSGKASAVKVIALNSACIVIGTRIDPLHS